MCELLRKRLDEERYSVRNGVEDTKKEVESQMRVSKGGSGCARPSCAYEYVQDMVLAHKESIDSLMKDSSEVHIARTITSLCLIVSHRHASAYGSKEGTDGPVSRSGYRSGRFGSRAW